MDSITHIVIGAAIGDALLGKKIGRKAALIGAFAKTIPDFDLFYTGLDDPKMYMCHHRGHTHSLIWEFVYAFPIAWIFYLLFKKKVSYPAWFLLFIVCLWGHSLLDTCTNYGTRLFLPFTQHPYSWNNIAIADLVFTVPMLILLIIGLIFRNNSSGRQLSIRMLLIYCVAYLGFTVINKTAANQIVKTSLTKNQINHQQYFTNPTILNNFLWYGMAVNDSSLYVGEFTFFKKDKPLQWHKYDRHIELLSSHPDTSDIRLLHWFSRGYSIAQQNGDTLNVYCVKFGRTNMSETDLKKSFIFHYKLYLQDGQWKMGMEEPNNENANLKEGFKDLILRIQGKR